jgi:ribonucleoside-diphosphate reductase alpha chain
MAFVPGQNKQQTYPSTISYVAQLILHRYAMLGLLDERGVPLRQMGILEAPGGVAAHVLPGGRCPECGNHTMIRKDGCDYCTACGYVGVCG